MPGKDESLERFFAEPLRPTADLSSTDIPPGPGVYGWYRHDELFYVGETHRGLRSRLWGNHVRGNARGSTLRNKVAKSFGFPPIGFRAYGPGAEAAITAKLLECAIKVMTLGLDEVSAAQAELISAFDPPMNDHPGERPRWRVDEVRRILDIVPVRSE